MGVSPSQQVAPLMPFFFLRCSEIFCTESRGLVWFRLGLHEMEKAAAGFMLALLLKQAGGTLPGRIHCRSSVELPA